MLKKEFLISTTRIHHQTPKQVNWTFNQIEQKKQKQTGMGSIASCEDLWANTTESVYDTQLQNAFDIHFEQLIETFYETIVDACTSIECLADAGDTDENLSAILESLYTTRTKMKLFLPVLQNMQESQRKQIFNKVLSVMVQKCKTKRVQQNDVESYDEIEKVIPLIDLSDEWVQQIRTVSGVLEVARVRAMLSQLHILIAIAISV